MPTLVRENDEIARLGFFHRSVITVIQPIFAVASRVIAPRVVPRGRANVKKRVFPVVEIGEGGFDAPDVIVSKKGSQRFVAIEFMLVALGHIDIDGSQRFGGNAFEVGFYCAVIHFHTLSTRSFATALTTGMLTEFPN